MRLRALLLAGCLLLTTSTLAGCESGSGAGQEPEKEKVLRYVNYSSIEIVDPTALTSSAAYTVACHVLEGLTRIYQYDLRYGMADSYEVSADGCTYTFHLRSDACYSDGEPVRAEDFRRAFQRAVRSSYYPNRVGLVKNAYAVFRGDSPVEELGVFAVDEKTLRIELEQPSPQFLQILALPMFAPIRTDAQSGGLRPEDCNGPFVLTGPEQDGVLRMEKNPFYWNRGSIALDAVEALAMTDSNLAYQAFLEGEANVVPIPIDAVDQFTGGEQRQVMTGISEYLQLDLSIPGPLQNKDLRLALAYALDRLTYVENLDNSLIKPLARCVMPLLPGVRKTYGEEYPDLPFSMEGDAAAAGEHLWCAVGALGVDGPEDIRLTLTVHNDYWSQREAEELIRQWREKLGITVLLELAEPGRVQQVRGGGEGGMVLVGGIEDYADPLVYLEHWSGDYSRGAPDCSSAQFNRYLAQAAVQTDLQIRLNCLYEAEKLLLEDVPMIPLQIREDLLLIDFDLEGFETSAILGGGGYEFIYADFK